MTDGLTPTAEAVLILVRERGPVSRQELLNQLDRHPETVDNALDQLRDHTKIVQTRDSDDLRQVVVDYTPQS